MDDRLVEVGDFGLLALVCGELYDKRSGFQIDKNFDCIDVVVDTVHGSIDREWDRAAEALRWRPFQRMFRRLGNVCGAVLAQAHEADTAKKYVRRQDNWVVFKDELPFPEVEVYPV